ncbi:Hia/Hsf adhesin N-terminal domain-containing protein [Haemophilus influenzae]
MNKIFSVIWNVMTQTWAVVSELTRAHTKRASATVAAAVLATVLSATVQASAGSTTGTNSLNVYGKNNSNFNSANNSIADLNKQNDSVYDGLLNLNEKGTDKSKFLVADETTATVGNLRKLGWVVSTKNSTKEESNQVKQADEVLFEGKDGVTVTSKSENGKHTVTFALANDLNVKNATVSDKLSLGANGKKVDITSDANGLKFAKQGTNGQNGNVHLNGIASTLDDPRVGGKTAHLTKEISDTERNRAASVGDVLNAGWNIRGAKTIGGTVDNVDFVSTYDTVEFASGANANVSVTTDDNKKNNRPCGCNRLAGPICYGRQQNRCESGQ